MAASNFQTEPSMPKRLGEIVTMPYRGDVFTAADGTVWKATNSRPLAYSDTYAQLLTDAPSLVTSAVTLNGPFTGNEWSTTWDTKSIVGSSSGGATILMMPIAGVDFYYTSTNAGASWTSRTPPVASKIWTTLWDGTNFVAYANATAGTGVQESTDGISWTARTAISLTLADFIFANSLYVAVATSGTALATSTDRTTWTSRTCTAQTVAAIGTGIGNLSWNAGAGLWIMNTSTAGQYQTSPDAITWTNRSPLVSDQRFVGAPLFASSSTVTVMLGNAGVAAYSTDCINWTRVKIDSSFDSNSVAQALYWDGAYFVAVYYSGAVVYYSTDGATWTLSARGVIPTNSTSFMRTPTGITSKVGTTTNNKLVLTDASSATKSNIVFPGTQTSDTSARAYVRIL